MTLQVGVFLILFPELLSVITEGNLLFAKIYRADRDLSDSENGRKKREVMKWI